MATTYVLRGAHCPRCGHSTVGADGACDYRYPLGEPCGWAGNYAERAGVSAALVVRDQVYATPFYGTGR